MTTIAQQRPAMTAGDVFAAGIAPAVVFGATGAVIGAFGGHPGWGIAGGAAVGIVAGGASRLALHAVGGDTKGPIVSTGVTGALAGAAVSGAVMGYTAWDMIRDGQATSIDWRVVVGAVAVATVAGAVIGGAVGGVQQLLGHQ